MKVKTFKVIVKTSDSCIDLLKYLDKHIKSINALGVRIRIEKISNDELDEEMVESLRKRGVTRLPALLDSEGKVFLGLTKIMEIFNKNLKLAQINRRVSPIDDMSGGATDNPDIDNFWMKELFQGRSRSGKLIPRDDPDEDDRAKSDIERRMAMYVPPAHRRSDFATAPTETPTRRPRRRREPKYEDEYDEDNINSSDDEHDPAPAHRRTSAISASDDARGDEMDRMMLDAFLQNNPE